MMESIFEIPSTTTRLECYILFQLASKLPDNSRLVELGTGAGRVTAVLAQAVAGKGSTVHTVDDYSEIDKYGPWGAWNPKDTKMQLAIRNLIGHVIFVEMSSKEAAKICTGKIDFLYLDAGHRYKDVCEDIDCWYPLVKPGGIIAGHDFDPNCDDGRNVIKAIFDKTMVNPDRPMTVKERLWWIEK
jgi:predicted O-methyltransferase YrrM